MHEKPPAQREAPRRAKGERGGLLLPCCLHAAKWVKSAAEEGTIKDGEGCRPSRNALDTWVFEKVKLAPTSSQQGLDGIEVLAVNGQALGELAPGKGLELSARFLDVAIMSVTTRRQRQGLSTR